MNTNSNIIIRKAVYVLGVWCAGLMFQPSLSAQKPQSKTATTEVRTVHTDVVTPLSPNKKGKKEMLPLVTYKDVEARVVGDTLCLRFTVVSSAGALGRNEALHIVPVYTSGEQQYPFRSIVLQDPLRHRFY